MKITQAVEYGILGVIYLARQPEGRLVMIDEICESEGVPKSFLAKIFQSLTKAGIVRSRQGAGGGFALTRKPEDISILNVIEAIEGKIALQRCLEDFPDCPKFESCALSGVLAEAQAAVVDVFNRRTIADLIQQRTPFGNDIYSIQR